MINNAITPSELIEKGNELRSQNLPEKALECYGLAFVINRKEPAAWNNYGNVLREIGDPQGAIPFIQRAISLAPNYNTAKFNLAVCCLLAGDYKSGWQLYESRWDYEHLAGTLPNYQKPRWQGEDIQGKTLLVVGEQGHGDNIQFVRFLTHLHNTLGATIHLQTTKPLVNLLYDGNIISKIGDYSTDPGEFDYWVPLMSIPGLINLTLDNLPKVLRYLDPPKSDVKKWADRLGYPKLKPRVGICWSGRRDSWINQHKGMPFEKACELIQQDNKFEWYNLQQDATPEELNQLKQLGVTVINDQLTDFLETASLMMNLDLILSVDTACAHLSGALGRPTCIMLNNYAVDWRWLTETSTSPWYQSATLYRQESLGDWDSVIQKVQKHLKLFKL